MTPRCIPLLFLLLLLPFAAPTSADVTTERPEALVAHVTNIWQTSGGTIEATVILSHPFLASDPNGALDYCQYINDVRFCTPSEPNAGAPGWNIKELGIQPATFGTVTFEVSANDTAAGQESALSCSITLDVSAEGNHAQCSTDPAYDLSPVPAVAASVGTPAILPREGQPAQAALVNLTWLPSTSEANISAPVFNYRLNVKDVSGDGAAFTFGPTTYSFIDPLAFEVQEIAATEGSDVIRYGLVAEHNTTFQQAELSCTVNVRITQQFDAAGCGGLSGSSAGTTGGPEFPGLDMTAQADAMGLTTTTLGWLIGGVLTMAGGLLGFHLAKGIGAGVGAILGFAFGVTASLIPLWLVVIVFLAAVAIIVFLSRGAA